MQNDIQIKFYLGKESVEAKRGGHTLTPTPSTAKQLKRQTSPRGASIANRFPTIRIP